MTTSTKPYLVRALYDWCVDIGFTPHIAVWVNEHTQVPRQFVQDEQIVLNIAPSACKGLTIENDWIHLQARFSGKSEEIWIPTGHVIGIFARENNAGMGFDVEEYAPEAAADETLQDAHDALHVVKKEAEEAVSETASDAKPSFLKIVK